MLFSLHYRNNPRQVLAMQLSRLFLESTGEAGRLRTPQEMFFVCDVFQLVLDGFGHSLARGSRLILIGGWGNMPRLNVGCFNIPCHAP